MAFLVDENNQEKFAIPNGETVIGRGPYLRVKEQILSRSHAVVSLNNGKVCIKPTHRNPTYFYSSDSVENCVTLENDKWKELVDGDGISLLPNSYKYHIEIKSPKVSNGSQNDDKQVNAEENENDAVEGSVDEHNSLNLTTTLCDIDSPCVINRTKTHSNDEDVYVKPMFDDNTAVEASSNKENKLVCLKASFETPTVGIKSTRKRTLPSWMFETNPPVKKKKTTQRKTAPKEQYACLPKVTNPIESPLKSDALHLLPDQSNEQSISTTFSDPHTNKYPAKKIPQIETSPLHESCYEINIKQSSQIINRSPIANMSQDEQTVVKSPIADQSQIEQIDAKSPIVEMSKDEQTVEKSPIVEMSQDEHTVAKSPIANEQTVVKSPVAEMSDDEQVVVKSPVAELSDDEQVVVKSPVAEVSDDEQVVVKSPVTQMSDDEQVVVKSSVAEMPDDEQVVVKSSIAEMSDDGQVVKSSVAEMHQGEHSNNSFMNDQQEKVDEEEDVKSKASSNSSEQQETSGNLKPCPYGKRCYRSNPVHFEEYSHSLKDRDDDINDDSEQNSDGNKTECPYGMKCYRQKNPHHTSKFTHTSIGRQRAVRKTRRQRKTKGKSLLDKEEDNDGENEYDLDDSFIASSDDSGGYSDDSADSDYKPYGRSDDDDDEDMDELISEAKGFIRNKKM